METFTDKEYCEMLESVVAVLVRKHYNGIFKLSEEEWDKAMSHLVGGTIVISLEGNLLVVTISGKTDA